MSTYSIKVQNNSGASADVAIYQSYPNVTAGLPLVWILKNINNKNNNEFTWETPWALNWGTSTQKLSEGVLFTSGGTAQSVSPDSSGGKNMMKVSYSDDDFQSGEAYNNPNIHQGSMQVETDTSFTVKESSHMSISVYMNGKPTFAMQGRPNGKYQFDTHPTYWLCITQYKEGVAVSGEFVTSPLQVEFKDGKTKLSYELTDTLVFKPIQS